jgi:urease accessory protein
MTADGDTGSARSSDAEAAPSLAGSSLDPAWLLQLADSAFPTGGFAHSAGLEAALGHGYVRSPDELRTALETTLWSAGTLQGPYVLACHRSPAETATLASLHDTQLPSPTINRASRAQGRALLDAIVRTFGLPPLSELSSELKRGSRPTHLAPIFGSCFRHLGASEHETRRLFLFTTLRSSVGAAVRLNIVGPFEGQRLQASLSPLLTHILERTAALDVYEAASPSPFWETVAATHDRLRTRLFQS